MVERTRDAEGHGVHATGVARAAIDWTGLNGPRQHVCRVLALAALMLGTMAQLRHQDLTRTRVERRFSGFHPITISEGPETVAAGQDDCDLESMKWAGIPYDRAGIYHPECRPQILYSWLTSSNLIDVNDSIWPFRRGYAFMFRSPLGSAMYGSFSYRVKLRPDVEYKLEPWTPDHAKCRHPDAEKRRTLYVSQDAASGFSEYVICSPDIVASWSFGTLEHLEEMRAERELIDQRGAENVDGYLNPNSHEPGVACQTCFHGYTIHDARNDGSSATIDELIAIQAEWVSSKRGRVYSLEDGRTYTSGAEFDAHFSSRLPLPFLRSGWPSPAR